MEKRRGFTLHEILIVLVILSALAALALPGYFRTVEVTRANEAKLNLEIIDTAEHAYYATHNNRFWPNPSGTVTGAAAINAGPLGVEISDPNYSIKVVSTDASYRATASRRGRTKSFFVNRNPADNPPRTDDFPDGTGSY